MGIENQQDLHAHTQKVSTRKEEPPKDLLEIITKGFEGLAGKFGGPLGKIFNNPLKQLERDFIAAPPSVLADTQGGAIAQAIMGEAGLNLAKGFGDFKGLVAAAVEPIQHMVADMHGQSMSYGDLGNLHSNAPGRMDGGGLSV